MSRVTHENSSGTKINLEGTAGADNIERRKDKRKQSSGSSTRSAGSGRKKHKLIVRVPKMRKSGQKKNFCFLTMMLPNGQKDLSHLKSSIMSIKISARSVSSGLQKVKDRKNANEKRMDDLEKAMQNVSDKVKEWVKEKAVLLAQINDQRARYDLKCDEIEQYSSRLCLVLSPY